MREEIYSMMANIEDRHWWFRAKRRIIRTLIDRYAPDQAGRDRLSLVDIGCGTGGLLAETQDTFDVLGLDSAEAARDACRARGFDALQCWLPNSLPVEFASADICILSDVLEHLTDDRGTVEAVADRLRPGGIVVCTVPAHPWLWTRRDDAHEHKRRYTRPEFEALFSTDLYDPVFVGWYMSWLLPLMLAERIARKLTGDPEIDDLTLPSKPLNEVLYTVFAAERHTLGRIPFPIGASIVSVHRRRI
jgi:SAM-dependent methyltransferase